MKNLQQVNLHFYNIIFNSKPWNSPNAEAQAECYGWGKGQESVFVCDGNYQTIYNIFAGKIAKILQIQIHFRQLLPKATNQNDFNHPGTTESVIVVQEFCVLHIKLSLYNYIYEKWREVPNVNYCIPPRPPISHFTYLKWD